MRYDMGDLPLIDRSVKFMLTQGAESFIAPGSATVCAKGFFWLFLTP
jgi:hypothetical protein